MHCRPFRILSRPVHTGPVPGQEPQIHIISRYFKNAASAAARWQLQLHLLHGNLLLVDNFYPLPLLSLFNVKFVLQLLDTSG